MATRRHLVEDPEEAEPLYGSIGMQAQVVKPWNVFQDPPREPTVGSAVKSSFLDGSVKFLKVFTIIFVFIMVIGTAILSKGTTLFMTSQIRKNITRPYCNKNLDQNLQFLVTIPQTERVAWIWLLIFAYIVPEFGTFFRSVRKCLYKSWKVPSFMDFLSLLITETCPAVGSAILIFIILPELDVVKGAMLTNAVCFVPAIVSMISRNACSINDNLKMSLDIISIVAQVSSFVVWPILEERAILYTIPVSVILISIGWWENFVYEGSQLPFIRNLGKIKKDFDNKTYFLYAFIAPWKCIVFLGTTVLIFYLREDEVSFLFDDFSAAFENHPIIISEIEPAIFSGSTSNYLDAIRVGRETTILANYMTPIWVWILNFVSTYLCYAFGKFACKIMVQASGLAFPVNLAVPALLSGLIGMCGMYIRDECAFAGTIPEYLFFVPPPLYFLEDFVSHQHAWIWLVWLLSQAWITVHIWAPNCDKLATTEQLFMKPMYDAFLIDQSLAMNRRRHETPRHEDSEQVPIAKELDPMVDTSDSVTRIYACGTMWHETREEMMEFLKSILRLDQDQSANRIVRNYLQLNLDSYYELETHIFFDDAYVRTSADDNDPHVNEYVELLVSSIDEAASKVQGTEVRIRPPKIYPTPYGGRLTWVLPGRTKMIAHLKDRKKIRPKKRWSQVMYMYYLLGYKLESSNLERSSKELRSSNTYILALDGDIDFQPEALHLLVDYMKKNQGLGAACGRIHPIGSGGMVWYQMFEYAIGHWLQKATEHVIGCVLCSPGCFSLFRGRALMDKSVMRKYTTRPTEAKHYVQYDQGEDRWLCTLLLQRGYRVEYSAASDAYTHCPEGFNEFYNQRRRWMPSTMANILDLLMDYQHTVKINDNISMLYIFYQVIMMIGTVIGPGTIFLMLIGAFVAAFGLDQWSSLFWNLAPILIFIIVCATCSSDIQLFFAGLISMIYGLVMMAVVVGVMLQITQDGPFAPSSLFFFCVAAEFILAAILHPKEFNCLKYGIIYYVTVPSMYMLLVIYSVFNMNNVSWGTREVTILPKKTPTEEEKKDEAEAPPKRDKFFSFLGANADDDSGAWEISISKLFKCMCCTYKSDDKEDQQLRRIQESMKEIDRKLDRLERFQILEATQGPPQPTTFMDGSKATIRAQQPDSEGSEASRDSLTISEEVVENSWFYDGDLVRGEVRYLDKKEETFWNELIEEYLHPIEDDKEKVSADLKDLRDKMVFSFLMLNSLFVLVVFLLTLEKDTIHVNWPIDPKVNYTFVYDKNEVHMTSTHLQLEPIGFVFLIFFALLLVVQFIAMVIHRFGTFSQIMSNTRLEFNLFNRNIDDMTLDEIKARDPLKIVQDLQRLKGINDENEELPDEPVAFRNTMHNLVPEEWRRSSQAPIYYLDKAFDERVKQINNKDGQNITDDRKKSVAFVNRRRQTIQKRQSQVLGRKSLTRRSFPINEEMITLDNSFDNVAFEDSFS